MATSIENLKTFPDHSKVWLYQSNRPLTTEEMETLETELKNFTSDWDSHGDLLPATAAVLNPYFAMVVVDQERYGLCGGSVDAKFRFMKEIGERYKVDFFDRMRVTIKENEEVSQIPFAELKEHAGAEIFDPLVTSMGEFRQGWPRPIAETKYARFVKQ